MTVVDGLHAPVSYIIKHVHKNTALLSSHRGCSKDEIWPNLILRSKTILIVIQTILMQFL